MSHFHDNKQVSNVEYVKAEFIVVMIALTFWAVLASMTIFALAREDFSHFNALRIGDFAILMFSNTGYIPLVSKLLHYVYCSVAVDYNPDVMDGSW